MLFIGTLILSVAFCSGHHDEGFTVTKHHDNGQLKHVLEQVHKDCPAVTSLYRLSYKGKDTTAKGNKLYAIAFGKYPSKHTAGIPEFKYVGNMHGNEVVGREMLLRWVHELCRRYLAKDPFAVKMIENTRIHVLPTMNPDGWKIANDKAATKEAQWLLGRANGNNVDLNRNFPDLDKIAFKNHEEGGPLDHLFREEFWNHPKLQSETQMVMKWILSNNFVLSANLHGGDVVANYPYDESEVKGKNIYTAAPDDKTFRKLALAYATHNPYMYGRKNACGDSGGTLFDKGITNGADWYSVGGGMQDFNYLASNAFEITVEMGCNKFPKGSELPRYWKQNGPALDNFALQVHTGLKGVIRGDKTPIADATLMVFNVTSPADPQFIAHHVRSGELGDYYRLLASGDYVVMATAEGYRPLLRCAKVANNPGKTYSAKHLDFVLDEAATDEVALDNTCHDFPGYSAVVQLLRQNSPAPAERAELSEREILQNLLEDEEEMP